MRQRPVQFSITLGAEHVVVRQQTSRPCLRLGIAPDARHGVQSALRQYWAGEWGERRSRRRHYRRAAWMAGTGLGAVTIAASLVGAARPGRDSGLCGRAQGTGVDHVVLAGAAGMSTADNGPAVQHGGREGFGYKTPVASAFANSAQQ